MRKISHIDIKRRHHRSVLNVNWGETYIFRNRESARRAATKLNKHYQNQLQHLNYILVDAFRLHRHYWLFLTPFDNREVMEHINMAAATLDHAFTYQDQIYNTPADISRAIHHLTEVVDMLMQYALKRKDVPIEHELKHLKQRILDDKLRVSNVGKKAEQEPKRPAIRKVLSRIQANGL